MQDVTGTVSTGDVITPVTVETSENYTELLTLIEKQNVLISEQTTSIDNGVVILCIGFGLIIGAIIALGLWKGLK